MRQVEHALFELGIAAPQHEDYALFADSLGYAAEQMLSWILSDLIASDLPGVGPMPVILASGSALVLLVGFALPSLIQLRNTPPLRKLPKIYT